ncbi:MarR family winged helix-turn-helix transcriptional regulator [Cryptosporangium aurantiacum]|uniref:DNA-binding transcriptional regulator, MarR family n=1 Tax=Cryptosporangium aurantiacum TaxID=134849 RepID=A0A1M7RJ89_9ACTN|nr:MarR family transcriptional regulator [Cryptosporangium aurantiacum]SHN46201.1 DNA-binding transcriptional regulator, MarR family [Cryptosporangium aurantiacum]
MIEDATESLSEAFWAVARQLRHATRESLEPWDITPGQGRALSVLMRHGQMRLSELSEHLRIAPRSTTEVVDALEERGLAERGRDPHDRRATLVALTERGLETGGAIKRARRAESDKLFGALSADDRAELARILGLLRR